MAPRSKMTVAGAVELYICKRERQQLAANTIDADRSALRKLVKVHGDMQMRSLKGHHLERLFEGPLFVGLAQRTFNNYRRTCKHFFEWAQKQGYASPGDHFDGIRKLPVPEKDRVRFTREETERIMCMDVHPVDKILLALLLNTCCRISDLRYMTVSCIDKTEARWMISLYRPKTGTFTKVRMTPILQACMEIWLDYYENECGPLKMHWPLVPAKCRPDFEIDADTGRHRPQTMTRLNTARSVGEARSLAQKAFAAAGIEKPKGEMWHTFRRTGARNLYDTLVDNWGDSGRAIKAVQLLLGHKQEHMTWHYIGMSREWDLLDKALMNFDFVGSNPGFKPSAVPQQAEPPAIEQTAEQTNVIDLFSRRRTG